MRGEEIQFIGRRIKEIRLSKSYKLTDTAKNAGISKGLLSRIENGRTIPSLPVLFSIIRSIDENPATFFEKLKYSHETPYFLHIREKDFQPVQKEDARGFHYYSILSRSFADVTSDIVLLILDPDCKREPVTTDGMEFIYLIKGKIDYLLGNEILSLQEGDALFFDGRIPHLKINSTTEHARILVVYFLFNH